MIRHFIKIAIRNVVRYKGFSFLNILSLTLGLTFALLIGLWVQDEWSYNHFHKDLDELYKVRTNLDWGELKTSDRSPGPLKDVLLAEIPEVKSVSRHTWEEDRLLSFGQTHVKRKGMSVDTGFLSMFTFNVLQGDAETALAEPNSIVLSTSVAEHLFGTEDAIGKTIKLDSKEDVKVTAIVEDVPDNSSIQFDWLTSWEDFAKGKDWVKTWGNVAFYTYVQLIPDTDLDAVNEKIAFLGEAKKFSEEFFLQPLADVYLFGNYTAGKQDGGRIDHVQLFSFIAICLLIIACVNFMNLATARASRRAREIGIRKTVGAHRMSLIGQFLGEAILLATISLIFALTLAQASLATFNEALSKDIHIDYASPYFWGSIIGLTLLSGLLAGSYPALFLSSLLPVKVLKGSVIMAGDRSALLRKGLVVFQFAISIFLIVGTLVIHSQIYFVKTKNLGLDRKDLFYGIVEGELYTKPNVFREKLLASPDIRSVAFTGDSPLNMGGMSMDLEYPGQAEDEPLPVAAMILGEGFTETFGIDLVEGRDFSSSFGTDTSNYLVNESAVKAMGLENPIGTEIDFWNGKGKIIGVTRDYHIESLHVPIRPMVLCYTPNDPWMAWIKPEDGRTQEAIAHVKKVAEELNPNYPFEYTFADEEFAALYKNETLTGRLANAFGLGAILISCLGLLGLAAYSAERRAKEISIRKVLGASINNILNLMSKEFIQLVIIALLISLPVGWLIMQGWLERFAYRVELSWWIFIIAGVSAIAIALFTVGFQSLKAALSNPIESLRNE